MSIKANDEVLLDAGATTDNEKVKDINGLRQILHKAFHFFYGQTIVEDKEMMNTFRWFGYLMIIHILWFLCTENNSPSVWNSIAGIRALLGLYFILKYAIKRRTNLCLFYWTASFGFLCWIIGYITVIAIYFSEGESAVVSYLKLDSNPFFMLATIIYYICLVSFLIKTLLYHHPFDAFVHVFIGHVPIRPPMKQDETKKE